ncbi:MAG TPA: GH116 family glycosyl-hydrolase [Chthonomonadaceae bacterium]|nr:GH116 family glycosyl-hydrolase [Chthonomonadaceae bacterium]
MWGGLFLLLSLGGRAMGQGAAPAMDAQTGIVHSQRLESGVPLGGIGTGTFELMTDGAVSRATINNNWSHPTGDLPACFAAVWTRSGDLAAAHVLSLHNAYGLPAVSHLDYAGLTPQAVLTFPGDDLPVTVSLQAFSPLVPFDIRNASFPAAAFVVTIKNPAPVPVECSVALSWENSLGVGGTPQGAFSDHTGDTVTPLPATEGFFGLKFTGPPLASEEQRMRDNATGEMTLLAYPPRREAIMTTAGWNTRDARPAWWDTFAKSGDVAGSAPAGVEGKAHPAGVVAVRLTLKPHDAVDLPFAIAWYMPHLYTRVGLDLGHYYQTLFSDSGQAARALLQDWRILLTLTQEWQMQLQFSDLPRWLVRRLINSAAPLITHTIHTRDGRFAFLADVGGPRPETGQVDVLASLSQSLYADTLLLAFFPELDARLLTEFQQLQAPNGILPPSLETLQNFPVPPVSPPPRHSSPSHHRSPSFGVRELVPALECGGLPPQKNSAASRLTESGGKPPHSKKGIQREWHFPAGRQNQQETGPIVLYARDVTGAAAFTLQLAQYVFWTGDRDVLQRVFPAARRALEVLLSHRDAGGLPDLSPSGPPPPEESDFRLTPAAASLWLAALRAAQRLADLAGDKDFSQACAGAFAQGSAGVMKRFWNGRFFGRLENAGGEVCSSDQLLGQWWADLLDLGPLLPEAETRRALESLQALNDRRRDFPYGPAARVRADGSLPPDDPAARDCLLPATTLAGAALRIAQEQPGEGMTLLERLDTTRCEVLRSPWRAPWRVRADTGRSDRGDLAGLGEAADWNILYALEGFAFDASTGRLALSVAMPGAWRHLSAPVFAPAFWGEVDFQPLAHGGVFTFRLDRTLPIEETPPRPERSAPALTLTALRVPGPSPISGGKLPVLPEAHISRGPNPIGGRLALGPAGDLIVTFEAPLALAVGDVLEVDFH